MSGSLKVLLATDGSPQAEVATRLVGALRWPDGTVIEILRVDEPFASDMELPPPAYEALHVAIRKEIDAEVAAARSLVAAPGREIRSVLPFARPATAIVDEAKRMSADLVVVGSRGRGQLATMLLGSVAGEVIDHAPCAVLVARSARLDRIVVADDGSLEAAAALDLVASWSLFGGLEARVVSVAPIPAHIAVGPVGDADASQAFAATIGALRARHQAIASTDVPRLERAGLKARAEIRSGDPARELVDAAVESRADLIVIGSHGRTGLARVLLGSVARNVVLIAPCSVLVVRRTVAREG